MRDLSLSSLIIASMASGESPLKALNELIADPQKLKEAGGLSRALLQRIPLKREERQRFCSSLADAHNAGKIDLVAEFALLRNGNEGPNFFSTRQVFVETFPELKTDCVNVAKTVAHLVIEAGADVTASLGLSNLSRSRFEAACRNPDCHRSRPLVASHSSPCHGGCRF